MGVPNVASVHTCTGECYEAYVAANGNILDQQLAAAEAAASASPAELGKTAFVGCTACHGAGGEGGIGPALAGRDSAFVVTALTAYKNREERGPQSAVMYPSAAALSDADIQNIAAFVESL
ncbi:MAG: c-type cytochrome [Gammaproteobacteria bacterium]|nr:c-type cytochrome [Gammaproteobacteria bacterium]